MIFPLNKKFIHINNSETGFLSCYKNETEIPILPHPGAFGKIRKNHIHEGVDLYCENMDEVFSMLDGTIIGIFKFTGEHIGSPWWNNTWSILIKHHNFTLNYGEIIPINTIKPGDKINEGQLLGNVTTVLKKDKGRPRNMLHLEMYENVVDVPAMEWALDKEKPKNLLDPTELLLRFITS